MEKSVNVGLILAFLGDVDFSIFWWKAYETYVRPLLEYTVRAWSPDQLEDIAKI